MRKHSTNAKSLITLFAAIVVLACSSTAFAGATITINNIDGPGEGSMTRPLPRPSVATLEPHVASSV